MDPLIESWSGVGLGSLKCAFVRSFDVKASSCQVPSIGEGGCGLCSNRVPSIHVSRTLVFSANNGPSQIVKLASLFLHQEKTLRKKMMAIVLELSAA